MQELSEEKESRMKSLTHIQSIKRILEELQIRYYESGGIFAISRDSMCEAMNLPDEHSNYTDVINYLKKQTNLRLVWVSKCDDYLYLDILS